MKNLILVLFVVLGFTYPHFANNCIELKEKRTYYSKSYMNEDGTITTEISLGYVHYKTEDGKYEEINRNFIPTDTMGYQFKVTDGLYHAFIKSDISSTGAILFETKDGYRLRMQLWGYGYYNNSTKEYKVIEDIKPSGGIVNGNEILFANAFNGVDVKYIYKETRLKEEIIFSQEARNRLPDPEDYGFKQSNTYLAFFTKIDFDTQKVRYYANKKDITNSDYEGEDKIRFKNFKNNLKFFFPHDFAYLESERDSLVRNHEKKVKKRIYKENGQYYLFSCVSLKWIMEKLPKGAIVIDPQIEISPDGAAGKDALVRISYKPGEAGWDTTNYGNASYLSAYAWTRSGYNAFYRSYFQFDLSSVPNTATINSATLYLYNAVYQHGSGDSYRASQSATYLRRVTEPWEEQTITWNTQPSTTTTDQVSVPAPATTTSDFEIDVTNLVRIMNDGQSNYGFLWILQNEQKYRSVFAASSDYSDPAKRPKLVVTYTPMKKYYYLKDHLGNIRVTVDENGDVKGYNDYYPFGLRMPGRSMNNALATDMYKYSSKELDEESGINWYYFGARYYDPAIGRWWSVDPLEEKYPGISPYLFTLNNPIKYYDPDGKQVRSDSPGLIYKEVYQRAAQLRLQKYGYAEPIADPKFQTALVNVANTYGPTYLDGLSLTAMGFGQFGVAAGLSYLSAGWTTYLSYKKSNPDGFIALTNLIAQSATKKKGIQIGLQIGQLLYDIYLSGKDYSKSKSKEDTKDNSNSFSKPDNTRVGNTLLQSLAKDLGWSTVDWEEIRKRSEKRKQNEGDDQKENQ